MSSSSSSSSELRVSQADTANMPFDADNVKRILQTIPSRYRGPGGAVAVLKDGELVHEQIWGYADMEKRIPMSSQVLLPICSITKQFVSALLLDLTENPPTAVKEQPGSFPEQMLAKLREVVPPEFVDGAGLTVDNLVDMCSGLRDYWALCTVEGSRPDTPYSLTEHNSNMLGRIKTLHFEPGAEYSYSNTNFNVVERLIEHVTKDSLANLLAERIFKPAKMTTAQMCPRTDRFPAPIVGYEGSEKFGFIPAPNFIEWSADAGMVASLADMIAYEKHFDGKYTDPQNNYRATVQPRKYKNGAGSKYRYGLRHATHGHYATVGHGGALRGFKLHRRYVEGERLSIIVLFNHSANATAATTYLIKQILGIPEPPTSTIEPAKKWLGSFLDVETQLAVRVTSPGVGKIKILYSRAAETLRLVTDTRAESAEDEAWIEDDVVKMRRLEDNRILHARRLAPKADVSDKWPVQGSYHCSETESTFICEGEGDMLYAMFNGAFGRGPPHLMTHLGEDVWVFADPRAMDDTPPGDWTVVFVRDESGDVIKATVGCWLARKLEFVRSR